AREEARGHRQSGPEEAPGRQQGPGGGRAPVAAVEHTVRAPPALPRGDAVLVDGDRAVDCSGCRAHAVTVRPEGATRVRCCWLVPRGGCRAVRSGAGAEIWP